MKGMSLSHMVKQMWWIRKGRKNETNEEKLYVKHERWKNERCGWKICLRQELFFVS